MEFQQYGQQIPTFQASSYFQQEQQLNGDAIQQKLEFNESKQTLEMEGSMPASLFQIDQSMINRIENDSNNNILQRASDLQNVYQMLDNGNSQQDISITTSTQIIKVQDCDNDQNNETLKQLREFLVDQIEDVSLNDIYANYELLTNYCLKQQFLLQNKHFNPKVYFQGKKISQIQFNDIFTEQKVQTQTNTNVTNANQEGKVIQNKPFEKQRKNFQNSKVSSGIQLDFVKEVKEESFSVGSVTPQSPAQNTIIAGFQKYPQHHISTPVKKNSINLSSASTKLGFQPNSGVYSYINSSNQAFDMSRSLLQSRSIQQGSNYNINQPQDQQKDEVTLTKGENFNTQNTQASKETKQIQKEKTNCQQKKKPNLIQTNQNNNQLMQKSPKSKLVEQINNFEAQASSNKNKNYISYIRDYSGGSGNKEVSSSSKQNLNGNNSKLIQNNNSHTNSATNIANLQTNHLKNVQINLYSSKGSSNLPIDNLNKLENQQKTDNLIKTESLNKIDIFQKPDQQKKQENLNYIDNFQKKESQISQQNVSKLDNLINYDTLSKIDNLNKIDKIEGQSKFGNLVNNNDQKKLESNSKTDFLLNQNNNNFLSKNKSLSPKGQQSIGLKSQLTKKERFQNLQLTDYVYSSATNQSQTTQSKKSAVINLNLKLSPKGSSQRVQVSQLDGNKVNDNKYESNRRSANSSQETTKQELKKVQINPGNKERKSISIHLESTKYYQYNNEQPISVKIDKIQKDSASKVTNSSNISQSPLSSQILKDQVKLKNEINKLSKLLDSNSNKQEQNQNTNDQITVSLQSTQQQIQSQTLINTASTSNTNKQSIEFNKNSMKKQMHYTIPLIKDLNLSKVSSQAILPEDNGSHREIKDYATSAANSRTVSPSNPLKEMRIPTSGNSLNNSNARLSSSLQPTPRDHHDQIHSAVINQNINHQVARNIASVISILNNKVSIENKSMPRGYNTLSNKSNPLSPNQRSLSRGKITPLLSGQVPSELNSRNTSQIYQSNFMSSNQCTSQNNRNLLNSPSYGSIFQPQLSQKYTQIYQQMELLNQKFNQMGNNNPQQQINVNIQSNLNSNNGSQVCLGQPNSSNTLRNSSKNNVKNVKKNI
ncbi:hypothetical protein TTHERM_00684650 (macronuclear) [Tetrahymena thermophila SB210]|uniref:Uncharacterized protein n=1 Tax=Tetrahymena thermophila (strain SB210) TaxID=312017 RepID=I7M452_TETTS|nr:hypothetical protein TTHERM_00684650 [Tetrahymena thermophila SB210]EAS04921.2 hypothetical protein TTHERM_00684650 [Tetrahymena thermophila SB210]|eukprot:XP_001025166.2 hypothetical protein TTHERM_00684650 [Tetrahymena thermophila SB210]